MSRWIWKTAVALITVLFAAVSCGSPETKSPVPEVTGPAFVLFYTDN